jgi:hypothetical protein
MEKAVRHIVFVLLISTSIGGCANNPNGSDFMTADINKYKLWYDRFPSERLVIGMPQSEIVALFGANLRVVEASQNRQMLAVDRWKSVQGPDYVDSTLILAVADNKLESWKVENGNAVTLVPRSW